MRTGRANVGIGLNVLLASLIAIAVVLALSFKYQQMLAEDHVREQGISLARVITRLPGTDAERLVAWRELFQQQQSDEHFAYGVIVDGASRVLVDVRDTAAPLPGLTAAGTDSWLQQVTSADGEYVEFTGPIRIDREAGRFRIGYRKPPYFVSVRHLPEVATLVLPVFLLVPLFLLLLRREVGPLREVNRKVSALLDREPTGAEVQDLDSLARQFNRFLEQANAQIHSFENERSELVTSEKFLHYRVARFEEILDALPDAVLVVDDEGTVTFANALVGRYLNVEARELQGTRLVDQINHPELRQHLEQHSLAQAVGTPFEFGAPDDDATMYRLTVQTLSKGPVTSYALVIRDASQEASARRSRSEFVAHLAHELKAPLNTLAMYSEALQNDADDPDIQLDAANVINDEVERLARLIDNLLSMTQIEMGTLTLDRQRVKLTDLVRDATEAMQRSAGDRQLEFTLDLPNDTVPVLVDKDLLRVAINNLMTNAIKYSDPGGQITVAVNESPEAVTISVADTGIGIPEAEQTQIFDKFFRSGEASMQGRSGHGLGLPLALDIVNLHHGSIRLESAPGEGSTFYIDLWKHTGVLQEAI